MRHTPNRVGPKWSKPHLEILRDSARRTKSEISQNPRIPIDFYVVGIEILNFSQIKSSCFTPNAWKSIGILKFCDLFKEGLLTVFVGM